MIGLFTCGKRFLRRKIGYQDDLRSYQQWQDSGVPMGTTRSSFSRSTAVEAQLAVFNILVHSGSRKHTRTSRVCTAVLTWHSPSSERNHILSMTADVSNPDWCQQRRKNLGLRVSPAKPSILRTIDKNRRLLYCSEPSRQYYCISIHSGQLLLFGSSAS